MTHDRKDTTMKTTTEAAERVREAAEEAREREAAGRAAQARMEAQQAAAQDAHDRRGERGREEFERRRAAVQATMEVVADAIRRAERAQGIAESDLQAFREAHRLRRDVSLARLERDLERVPADLDAAVARTVERLNSAHESAGVAGLATLLGLDRLADPAAASRLRELIDGAAHSALDSDQFDRRLQAAGAHKLELEAAIADAREQAQRVGQLWRAAEDGQERGDPAPLGVLALDANQRAQTALEAVRTALSGEPTTKGAQ